MYGFFSFLTIIFLLILLSSIVLLVVGLFKPARVLRWGNTKTRSRVLLIFLPAIFFFFILVGVSADNSQTPEQKVAFAKQQALKADQAKKDAEAQATAKKAAEDKAKADAEAAAKKAAEDKAKADAIVKYQMGSVTITKPSVKTADVIDVVDGDTIKVKVDGKEETVRFTLVDTPETKDPNKPVEPFGQDASDFTKQQLSGKQVGLELDAQERDQYGRLLAYVWLDSTLFNGLLLDKGFARVAVYPPNTKYVDQFKTIQDYSKHDKKGIWSIENYVTDGGYNDDATKPKEQPAAAPAPQTVQNNNSNNNNNNSNNAVESSPAPQPAPQPQPAQPSQNTNVSYANCSAVKAAGKAPLYKGDPGYSSKLDRDGDGIACEK